jgi:hypothetical protein
MCEDCGQYVSDYGIFNAEGWIAWNEHWKTCEPPDESD